MELYVSTQIDGEDVLAGKLYSHVRRGTESATFSYAQSYLEREGAFALEPALPLVAGPFHTNDLPLFRVFEDCMPDRWGRNLITRAERANARDEQRAPRSLFEGDYLASVSDETRQGAIRIWSTAGKALASQNTGVPREVSIPQLLGSADKAARDIDADVQDLIAAGSSLGGARPKASVRDERGNLNIAKFPKANESAKDDVCAWEYVALRLAKQCGITTPKTRLLRVDGRAVLLLERFDRIGSKRIPYISGLTAIQGLDGNQYSYLELAEFIEEESPRPEHDLQELWRRILFSCAVGNTDDHMRNHGFLRIKDGWTLSPMFDVNPTPGSGEKYLNTALDFDERTALPKEALAVCEYYRVSRDEAKKIAHEMAAQLQRWKKEAGLCGISANSIANMASCFETGTERLKAF